MPSLLHRHTPTLAAMDPRGLVLRSVAYHRASADTPPQARIRRHTYGATGLLETQWDPRLYALRVSEPATRPNQRTHYSLTGKTLRTQRPTPAASAQKSPRW